MMNTPVIRGQIWKKARTQDPIIVCGSYEGWVWYTPLNLSSVWDDRPLREIRHPRPWIKAKENHFSKAFVFQKQTIYQRAYWKKKATGQIIQVTGLKDNGVDLLKVYFDLQDLDVQTFYNYFEHCTEAEYLIQLAKDQEINPNISVGE